MIMWMWHDRVPTAKAAADSEFTNGRSIPDRGSCNMRTSAAAEPAVESYPDDHATSQSTTRRRRLE